MKTTLSKEDIQAKVDLLSEREGCKVTPIAFFADQVKKEDQVLIFLKKPDYYARGAAFDTMVNSPFHAGELILSTCLIADESDSRVATDEDIKFSAVMACVPLIGGMKNELAEKKN